MSKNLLYVDIDIFAFTITVFFSPSLSLKHGETTVCRSNTWTFSTTVLMLLHRKKHNNLKLHDLENDK